MSFAQISFNKESGTPVTKSIPVLIDPSPYNTWSSWGADQRDLFFLDLNGNYVTDFNITSWNYDEIYNTILALSSQ